MALYTPVSISGYNTSPPSDDGTQAAQNEITWAKHKTKLADPVKTLAEGIDTNVAAAFGKVFTNSSSDISTNTTLDGDDIGKTIRVTNATTISLTAAATLGDGWAVLVINEGTDTVTIDPNASETINGATTITLDAQYDFALISCDGTDFLAAVKNTTVTETFSGLIEFPLNQDYTLVLKAPYAGTITETTTKSASGTCTMTFKVNTTALGGTANSVSTSEQSQAHASANTFAADDDIVVTVSANSSCERAAFTIKHTRAI